MGQAAQRRLDAAGDDRHAGERLAGAMAVGQRGAIGTQADAAARRIGVVVADLLVGRVVVDERIHVAGADAEEQARPAKLPPRLAAMPVRLAEHGDAEAGRLQHARQDGHGEAGMIDVGVAGDEDDIDAVPAARPHLGAAGRRQRRGVALVPQRQRQPCACRFHGCLSRIEELTTEAQRHREEKTKNRIRNNRWSDFSYFLVILFSWSSLLCVSVPLWLIVSRIEFGHAAFADVAFPFVEQAANRWRRCRSRPCTGTASGGRWPSGGCADRGGRRVRGWAAETRRRRG